MVIKLNNKEYWRRRFFYSKYIVKKPSLALNNEKNRKLVSCFVELIRSGATNN